MKTQTIWTGKLSFSEENPVDIVVGKVSINAVLHFMSNKRVLLKVELLNNNEEESSQISTLGKLEYDQRKKQFMFEKYPLIDFLAGFEGQKIKLEIGLDHSVLSSRMSY
jgi:hypothetical protein